MIARRTIVVDHHRGARPLLQPISLWRAILFVTINVMGFAVVSAFWQYLSTGEWINFDAFFRNLFVPLGAVFLQPLVVFTHPWMVLVYGLLLGVTVSVPIMVAILYRLRVAAIFLLLLAFVAQLPLLAAAVVTGCLLIGHTPLRSNMPMAAALLGILPAIIYVAALGCLTLSGATDRDYWATVEPFRRWVLYGPYVLALLSVIVASALVLALAKATRFRPGVVWPVLLVLSAAPMVTFYVRVGSAELRYSIIANPIEPGDSILAELPLDQWRQDHPEDAGLPAGIVRERIQRDLHRRRDELRARCEQFLTDYPYDVRAPEIMWIMAQCRSLQLDGATYQRGLISGTCVFVMERSRAAWQDLVETYPHSDQAAIARWRLAELVLRSTKHLDPDRADDIAQLLSALDDANELLYEAAAGLEVILSADEPLSPSRSVFAARRSRPSRSYYIRALHEVHRLQRLIESNELKEAPAGVQLLATWLSIDPALPDVAERYERLAQENHDSALADNLRLAAALAERDQLDRARKLVPLVNVARPTDATVEATFELASIQGEGVEAIEGILPVEVYLRSVIAAPDNPWQAMAAERLDLLSIARRISP